MKNFWFLILTLLSIGTLSNCGSDDDNDPYAGIPAGEIVALDQRDVTLIGTTSSSGRVAAVGQKWWKFELGEIRYNGECTDETESYEVTNTYYAFYSSNQFFFKNGQNGTPGLAGSWQWDNTNTKEALLINHSTLQGLTLTLRALNTDQLVYMSEVVDGDCTTIVWEELGDPHQE